MSASPAASKWSRGQQGYLLAFSIAHMRGTQWKVIKSVFLTSWQSSAVCLKGFLSKCGLLERWYPPVHWSKSTQSNRERRAVVLRLLWGLSRRKKSTEELQKWKMLVCQFVTKAVCFCVIDWQTVLAQSPLGHAGVCCRVTFFKKLLSFSEGRQKPLALCLRADTLRSY